MRARADVPKIRYVLKLNKKREYCGVASVIIGPDELRESKGVEDFNEPAVSEAALMQSPRKGAEPTEGLRFGR